MPLPQPKPNEEGDDFMKRCMNDDVIKSEYPNIQQRMAVYYVTYRDAKTQKE
jgi:hypothetical protein